MNDDKIIDLFWQRSDKALHEARQKYEKYCYAIAYRILQSREDAEECVNDMLLRVWQAIPPARPALLRTFLGKVTRNLSMNYLEKKHANKRGSGQVELILSELEDCIPSVGSTIESVMAEQDVLDVINRFLSGVSISKRKVFVRRYWYGSSIKEISQDYSFSESKVNAILFKLRKN